MQFDITGFLIFLAFILPGFVAQKSRDSIVPRYLKSLSPVAEVGEFVLAGVWVHALLILGICLVLSLFAKDYFAVLTSHFKYEAFQNFLWSHRIVAVVYFISSLGVGYWVGFVQGWFILQQPVRNWALSKSLPTNILTKLGVPAFLEEQPVWYFALKQTSNLKAIFVEAEMKNGAGFYTGQLLSYGILDDSVKSKDFYLIQVHFKQDRSGQYAPLKCDGILLNFEDVASVQIKRIEADSP
jgi:hypothetical protein